MSIYEDLQRIFFAGDKYTNKEIKDILQRLYKRHGIDSLAQATHLKLYGFKVKRAILVKGDKRIEGLKIIK